MDESAAEAVVALVRESITEGCASRRDLTAALAVQKDGIDERLDGMDKRLLVLEERSRTWVTKHELAAALKEERRYTDAQFERVWGEIKDVGKSVTTLHEKMFGRTANSIRIAAALAAMLFIALQVYDMFFRV